MKRTASALLLLCMPVLLLAADKGSLSVFVGITVGTIGLALAVTASMCSVAMGSCINSALQSIARQPELTSKIQLNLMLGLAFIESLVLYVMFIAIILLFANPFMKFFE